MAKNPPVQEAGSVPTPTLLKFSLAVIGIFYAALGATALALLVKGGHSWRGDTGTLTTVLAVLGVIFTISSKFLLEECIKASLQRLANRSIKAAVPMSSLLDHDIATKGSLLESLMYSKWRGPVYRFTFPIFAIIMSAVLKKIFTVEQLVLETSVAGANASLIDPVIDEAGQRTPVIGTAYPGAIVYNTTTSIGSSGNPSQTSWTYMMARTADPTGMENVTYVMPRMPLLVVEGDAGYVEYSAKGVPSLVAHVICSSQTYEPFVEGEIFNGNYNVSLGYLFGSQGFNYSSPIAQVTTAAGTGWSCIGTYANATANVNYTSDGSGNWIVSSVENLQNETVIDWLTTAARWNMMSDIMSDALGATAGFSGWDWYQSGYADFAYPNMLVCTRLGFAASLFGFSKLRMGNGADNVSGTAKRALSFVVVKDNWALIITLILLLVQSTAAFAHVFGLGKVKLDLSILQLVALTTSDPELSNMLRGHSVGLSPKVPAYGSLAVRGTLGEGEYQRLSVLPASEEQGNVTLQGTAAARSWGFVSTKTRYK
jgi:hypothetical protein